MIRVPLGLTFQASRCVSAGIGAIGCGYIDIGFLLVLYFIPLLLAFYYFFHSPAESCGGAKREVERGHPAPRKGTAVPLTPVCLLRRIRIIIHPCGRYIIT